MPFYDAEYVEKAIAEFAERVKKEESFCRELFDYSTVRVMAMKYAYYVINKNIIDDDAFDIAEKEWYIIGRGLGVLKKDETSPCVGFDENHPKAKEAIDLAKALPEKRDSK